MNTHDEYSNQKLPLRTNPIDWDAADRDFFNANPERNYRARRPHPGEIEDCINKNKIAHPEEFECPPTDIEPIVFVRQFLPGDLCRFFAWAHIGTNVEELTEEECRTHHNNLAWIEFSYFLRALGASFPGGEL